MNAIYECSLPWPSYGRSSLAASSVCIIYEKSPAAAVSFDILATIGILSDSVASFHPTTHAIGCLFIDKVILTQNLPPLVSLVSGGASSAPSQSCILVRDTSQGILS